MLHALWYCGFPRSCRLTFRTADRVISSNKPHFTLICTRPLTTVFPIPVYERIDASILVEEETLPGCRAEKYFPVPIGQTFNERYKILGKLGYGSASTVWLCRNLHHLDKFAALKIYINNSKFHRELPVYKHINNLRSEHDGRDRVRKLLDAFETEGPYGIHICLVHEPLGISLDEMKHYLPDGIVTIAIIREAFRWILRGLEFLHQEAHVIHTDLQANNILLGTENNAIFEKFESYEAEYPVPRKEMSDRTIYLSRPVALSSGLPALSDLSEARFGVVVHEDDIMPDVYRAPEVILGLPWSYPVDIWSLGHGGKWPQFAQIRNIDVRKLKPRQIWEMFEGDRLFSATNPNGQYSERYHLAQMVALLGPPPLDLIRQSKKSERFWNNDGHWIADVPIPDIDLETAEHRLQGDEKSLFLAFMKKMLQWKPENRASCRDIFFDEWLLGDLIEAGLLEPPPHQ